MTEIWAVAALWLGLALVAALLSIRLRIATALSEILVGVIAQLLIGALVGASMPGTGESWVTFLSGTGAVMLTFLAGAELDPEVFRRKWKEAGAVGLISFFAPFLGCAAAAHYLLGWEIRESWLAGIAMSTTSVAVVYAETEAVIENSQEHYETLLVPLREEAASQGLNARLEVAVGHPAEQIIYHAERNAVDLIVLGHRGKTVFQQLLLGSVTKQVIQYADCPVLVVR
ncbi:MAG: universal stress protein [Gammaproteobacteria bacterium]